MDAKGALAAAFDVAPLKFTATEIAPRLYGMAMNTEDSLREYLRLFVRVPLVGRIGPLARTFDFVADADHTFTQLPARERLVALLDRVIGVGPGTGSGTA